MLETNLAIVIRSNIDFISKEIVRVEKSEEIKNEVLDICANINAKVLGRMGEDDSKTLLAELDMQLKRFGVVIDGFDKAGTMHTASCMLLMTHVGDILHTLKEATAA